MVASCGIGARKSRNMVCGVQSGSNTVISTLPALGGEMRGARRPHKRAQFRHSDLQAPPFYIVRRRAWPATPGIHSMRLEPTAASLHA